MSEREQIQRKIADFIRSHRNIFTAPYGVIEGLNSFGKGKVRTVTFGIARHLDAHIKIIKPNDIKMESAGPLSYKFYGEFKSAEELIDYLKEYLNCGKE